MASSSRSNMVVDGRRGEMVSQYIFSLTSFFLRLQVTQPILQRGISRRGRPFQTTTSSRLNLVSFPSPQLVSHTLRILRKERPFDLTPPSRTRHQQTRNAHALQPRSVQLFRSPRPLARVQERRGKKRRKILCTLLRHRKKGVSDREAAGAGAGTASPFFSP